MVTTVLCHPWLNMVFSIKFKLLFLAPKFLPNLVPASLSVSFSDLLYIKIYTSGKPNPSQFSLYTMLFLSIDLLLMESPLSGDTLSRLYLPRALLLILKGSVWVKFHQKALPL